MVANSLIPQINLDFQIKRIVHGQINLSMHPLIHKYRIKQSQYNLNTWYHCGNRILDLVFPNMHILQDQFADDIWYRFKLWERMYGSNPFGYLLIVRPYSS